MAGPFKLQFRRSHMNHLGFEDVRSTPDHSLSIALSGASEARWNSLELLRLIKPEASFRKFLFS
jgi:hypothetical protein